MTPAPPCPWRNARILLTLALVFLCGATAGMLVYSLGIHRLVHAAQSPRPLRDTGKDVLLERFKHELDLTPSQTEELDTVLDDFFTYYHTLQAQLDDVRASGKQRILRILNDDQKRKFEKLMTELQQQKQLR